MSTFRRIDNLLDGKTSEELAKEVAAREHERAEQDQRRRGRPANPPGAGDSPREQNGKDGWPSDRSHEAIGCSSHCRAR